MEFNSFIMKKIIFMLLFSIITQNFIYSQSLEDKNVLVVWGGYKPHQPKLFAKNIINWLKKEKANIHESNNLNVYSNYDSLIKFDLIIQSVTMMNLSSKQEKNLTNAVKNGVGIAGSHGGLGDSFRNNTAYQFMIGGQLVANKGVCMATYSPHSFARDLHLAAACIFIQVDATPTRRCMFPFHGCELCFLP